MIRDMNRSDSWRKGAPRDTLDKPKDDNLKTTKKPTNTPAINNTTSPCPPKVNTILNHSPPHANTRSKTRPSATAAPSPVPQVDGATDTVDTVSDITALSDNTVEQYKDLQTKTDDIMQQLLSFRELYLASKHNNDASDDEGSSVT